MRKFILVSFITLLTAIGAFSQSSTTLRNRCPNTSIYSIVQITGVGDINVQPCVGKTTTFTQNIVLPSSTVIPSASITLADGAAATPSLTFTSDTDTGLYRSAANSLAVTAGGVNLVTFAPSSIALQRTVTPIGTTGAQTINKPAGTVNVAAAASSIVITNSTVTVDSLVFTSLRTADATCTFIKSVVPTANTITITLNAACGATTSVAFFVTN